MAFMQGGVSAKVTRGFDPSGESISTLAITYYNRVAVEAVMSEVAKAVAEAARESVRTNPEVALAIAEEIKAAIAMVPVEAIKQAVREAIAEQAKVEEDKE